MYGPMAYDHQTTGKHSSRSPADPLGAVGSAWMTTDRTPDNGTNGTVVVATPTPPALTVKSSHTWLSGLGLRRCVVRTAGPAGDAGADVQVSAAFRPPRWWSTLVTISANVVEPGVS